MKNRIIKLILALSFLFSALPISTDASLNISMTDSQVYVNGKLIPFDSYNINGNNYFKLRDIAYHLNGTESQFSVNWISAYNTIALKTGSAYTPVGGEGSIATGTHSVTVSPSTAGVTVNGSYVNLSAYNINGNNYFKLRDLGNVLNFGVSWSAETNSVIIYTNPSQENIQVDNSYSDYINEVLRLTNEARASKSLSPLKLDANVTVAANVRANELNTLFSHTRPDGRNCFSVFEDMHIMYSLAAENIAIGQRTPENVVNGWLNSPGHYANIMNSEFTTIGIGVAKATSGNYNGYAWVQLFKK